MATYLQLCQQTARDSGTVSGTQPTSVTAQTGRLAQIVALVAEAWTQIQQQRNAWMWMRAEWSGQLIPGTAAYTAASFSLTRHSRWITDEPKIHIYDPTLGVGDERAINFMEWPLFQAQYLRGAQTNNRPTHVTVRPWDRALVFGPAPDLAYMVRGDRQRSMQTLAANTDVPECPEDYHNAIKWLALLLLNEFDEAPVSRAFAESQYTKALAALEREQLPAISYSSTPIA